MEAIRTESNQDLMSKSPVVLSMRGISKSFSGVTVLNNVNIDLYKGEVHALMGENGAGKSTLMKIMAGIHRPDTGSILYRERNTTWPNAMEARKNGISVIHQELNLSPNITIGENVLMGTRFPRNKFGMVDWKQVHQRAHTILQSIGSELDPRAYVSTLSVAQQQMVEIARALSIEAEVLVMDEPTASLTHKEIEKLFIIINELKQKGVAIVYISHRMDEIFRISDRCTILRDGQWIASVPITETNPDHLVKTMVGRELNELFQKPSSHTSWIPNKAPVLEVKGLSDNHQVKDISLEVYSGEVLGISGLVGAGRTELVRAIFGLSTITAGEIRMDGKQVVIQSPEEAMRYGIAHVPESRKEQGLFLNMSVKENIMMAEMFRYRKASLLDWDQINHETDNYIRELGIKTASKELKVVNLSGGNQQKVLLARWLSIKPKVLLLDEPTRGVDIGAKTEIHKVIHKLAKNGLAVIMISSELPEILALSDRILVMHEGKIRANLQRKDATQEKIMYYATGEIK